MCTSSPRLAIGVALLSLSAACGSPRSDAAASSSARPAAAPGSADRPVVIELGPNGQTRVEGGSDLKGDPKTCAAMKACCAASSDVGLFCGLSQATSGATCASVLASTQQYLSERKLAKPAGCP